MPFIVSCRKEYARYIPGRCLLLDSTVMLTPKINSGMHTNPYDSHLRQGLTKPIIHRLCLSFLYIDSLLQERQQTLAAHKDSPPLSPTRTTSCDRGRTFYRQREVFSVPPGLESLVLVLDTTTTNRPLDSPYGKRYRKNRPKVLREDRLHLRDVPNPCLGATPTSTHQRPTKQTT